MLKKLVMSVTLIFSLQACTTLEIAHSPLELPGIPDHKILFRIGETDHVEDETYDKFEAIINAYKQRIITQLKISKEHNRLHDN